MSDDGLTPTSDHPLLPRRHFLREAAGGLGALALAYLLRQDRPARAAGGPGGDPHGSHFPPRAKRVLQVFLTGGISQVDSFDYKPELIRHHGKSMPGADGLDTFNSKIGTLMKSPWAFRRHGECGRYVSDLLPHLAGCVDDLAFIHSMTAISANHGPAQLQMNTGFVRNGFPSMGSWISYGLGSSADDLPVFVVLPDPRGIPAGGARSGRRPSCRPGTREWPSTPRATPSPTCSGRTTSTPKPTGTPSTSSGR